MVPAKDSASIWSKRYAWIALAILSAVADLGCAQLRSFRKHPEAVPAFGTEASEHGSRSGDFYADHLAPTLKRSKAALARADRKASDSQLATADSRDRLPNADSLENSGTIRSGTDKEPVVALQPPVSIPSLKLPDQQTLLANSEASRHAGLPKARNDALLEPLSIPEARVSPTKVEPVLATILAESRQALNLLTSYQVKMTHQQRVGLLLQSPEDVVMSIRRQPKAVRLEWPDGSAKGREVVYAADSGGGLMHVKMPNPLLPRLSMAPDGPMAVRTSRHPITEAGFDTILVGMESALQAERKGDTSYGKIRFAGIETPHGLNKPCQKIVRVSPELETWVVYLDPDTHLPALVQANANNGELLERHVFKELTLNLPELAGRDAFDPVARWGPNKGFFQRLAEAPAAPVDSTRTR